MATENFDLIIIGGGPAGYTGAIRAAQLGFKTACIEKDKTLGGTCLNVGCIPSKALLESSEHYAQAKGKLTKHGVGIESVKLDLAQMMKRKGDVVRQLTSGVAGLFKKHGVAWVPGTGTITAPGKVTAKAASGETRELTAPRILLATGSEVTPLPFLPFDGKRILSSTEALEIPEVPKHLVIIGGGVIGVEMGSVWSRLGAKITVIEFTDRIVPGFDLQAGKELHKALVKQGIEFRLSTKCTGAKIEGPRIIVSAEEVAAGGAKFQLEADYVLVSTGRRPYTKSLGLESVGIALDKLGRVPVDADYRTTAPGISAVGDIIVGPMLAHKAEEEAVVAVEIMAGQKSHVNYEAIPNVVYTWPELASVGYTEEELKAKGVTYKAGSFPFMANGRAKAMDETEGFTKILADAKTGRLLGMHICGPRAGDLIHEGSLVMELGGTAQDIARTSHAHPTLHEVVKEAALAVDKRQINF